MPATPLYSVLPLVAIHDPPNPLRQGFDPDALRELADSMARLGLLQPIGVTRDQVGGTCTVVYGHRRLAAARLLGWADIPCLILAADTLPIDPALAENLHRAGLTPIEEARACSRLVDAAGSLNAAALVARKSSEWVAARLRLLQYPADLQDAIHAHGLALSVAHLLAQIDHADYRSYLTRDALAHGASARSVSVWLQHYVAERDSIHATQAVVSDIAARRDDYIVVVPCDYCGGKDDLRATTAWRLCGRCSRELRQAQAAVVADSGPSRT